MTTEQFHWTAPTGAEIVLPRMDKIKGGLLRKFRKLNEADMMFSIIEEIADEPTIALIDDLGLAEMNKLFEAWQKDAAPVGKS